MGAVYRFCDERASTVRDAETSASLWRDRAGVLFWAARVISISGSTITAVVLPILVFQLTGSALQTALLATLEVLPYFVFRLLAGALADRVDRRRLMVGCNLAQALLVGSIPAAAALGVLTLTQVYVVVVLAMTAFVWFDAANFGALPALVGRGRVVEANSAIWGSPNIRAPAARFTTAREGPRCCGSPPKRLGAAPRPAGDHQGRPGRGRNARHLWSGEQSRSGGPS